MKTNILNLMIAVLMLMLTACNQMKSSDSAATSSGSLSDPTAIVGKINMSVSYNGQMVYSGTGAGLNLTAGQMVTIDVSLPNAPPGVTFALQSTQTNVPSGTNNSIPLQAGSNTVKVPDMGDYAWTLQAKAPGYQTLTQNYLAAVQCSDPTFTSDSLSAAGISVSLGSAQNIYNYSASGVIAGANGKAPYTCAWDPTGTGIQDTVFGDCSSQSIYDNYVGMRDVGVLVKDACNTVFTKSAMVNLAYTEPSMPGNVFIFGQVSGATGAAADDSRVSGVTYLATNANGNNIVQPNYGSGVFDISAQQNYGMPSSVKFGMEIKVSGITDSINVKTGMGAISAASAKISSVSYSTDQAGDADPAITFSGSSCTLSNQGAKVQFTAGQPCTAGTSGDNNMATVEVWGHYNCTGLDSNGDKINVVGDFDGYQNLVDNCTGGGGGGGGVTPINL